MSVKRIVLAYSTALERTGAIRWLAGAEGAEIVTLSLDFGQGRALEALRDQALASGAVRAHVLDVADTFATRFVLPALQAGALFADGRPMTAGLARALLAQKLVEIAAIEQTTRVAHGDPPDDPRIATAAQALSANLTVLTLPPGIAGSTDGGGERGARPWAGGERPSGAALVELTFVRGAPTAVNGVAMPLGDLMGSLNMLATAHGVGSDTPGDTPAAMVLYTAQRTVRDNAPLADAKWRSIGRAYVDIIDRGEWFSPARDALHTTLEQLQRSVNGIVRLQFFNGVTEIVDTRPLPADDKLLTVAATKGRF